MALRDWVATATPATPATHGGESGRTVATVATVAVATPANDAASPEQAAELRKLIALILARDSEADRAEALTVAVADPDAALTTFRVLAVDFESSTRARTRVSFRAADDDRQPCTECANLTARDRRCLAAWRGERPGNAPRDYHPVIDIPRRCECFVPKATEADQRKGAERWPYLMRNAQHG